MIHLTHTHIYDIYIYVYTHTNTQTHKHTNTQTHKHTNTHTLNAAKCNGICPYTSLALIYDTPHTRTHS